MIGPILLAISWLLLRLEGKRLDVLGFDAPWLRLRQFAFGFLAAGAVATMQQLGLSLATGVPWRFNPSVDVLYGLRWNVNSVLYEELLFRGYLLYQAIRFLGLRRGVLLDAVAFGIYHWFSFGAFGNPVAMVFILLFTGAFGFMFAFSFAKTKGVAAPIGLHLGWNLISYLGFSAGPLGRGLFVPANGAARIQASGAMALLLDVGVPLALVGFVCWYLRSDRVSPTMD